jgi:hypothetical protein
MSDLDTFDPEAVALALGGRIAENLTDWERQERAKAWEVYFAQMAAEKRRQQRREEARQIRVLKAMQRAGLPIRAATVDGVAVELGQVEKVEAGPVTELDQWIGKQRARSS